jgi:hypothetical protein
MSAEHILAREPEVRAALGGRKLTLRLLLPPYAAVGLGTLRVVRLRERPDSTEMLCSYEGYERIGGH